MKGRLIVKAGEFKGATFDIAESATIGRAKDNEVYLPSELISSKHAQISLDESANAFFVEDLGSLNGTELDGVRLASRERLDRLHVIRLSGAIDLIWQGAELLARQTGEGDSSSTNPALDVTLSEILPAIPPSAKSESPTASDASERSAPSSQSSQSSQSGLSAEPEPDDPSVSGPKTLTDGNAIDLKAILEGSDFASFMQQAKPARPIEEVNEPALSFVLCATQEGTTRRFVLEKGQNSIGNDPDAAVALFHQSVLAEHAVLTVAGSRLHLRKVTEAGQISVDGQAISGEVEVALESAIKFGEVEVSIERAE